MATLNRRRWLAPEVIQTSAMDCGPATLKCLVDGFGLHASYGRLREACQTDVDGTSIDTIEELANDLGLVAEQIIVPRDFVPLSAAALCPAMAVVRQSTGFLHFSVVWRRHGPLFQIMDPSMGRRWQSGRQLESDLHEHVMAVPVDAWREWAASDLFVDSLHRRASTCHVSRGLCARLMRDASAQSGWQPLAALDAALRMLHSLRDAGLSRREASRTLEALFDRAAVADDPGAIVPERYWSVRRTDVSGHVLVRGAILVHVTGVHDAAERHRRQGASPPEVAAATAEAAPRPLRHLWSLLRGDHHFRPATLATALLLSAAAVVLQALLLQALIDVGARLVPVEQRLAAIGVLLTLAATVLALEWSTAIASLEVGRRLDTRLRIAFLRKVPRLADRYFNSRPISDMASRVHTAHHVRDLPTIAARVSRATFELAFTTVGIGLLFPQAALLAVAAAAGSLVIPVVAQPWFNERELRQRTHAGGLAQSYLDAFRGLLAVRAHGGERALVFEQESLLLEWSRASRALLRTAVATCGTQLVVGVGFVVWLIFARIRVADEASGLLLLAYWGLNIPFLGVEIAQLGWQYATQRNLTVRLLEPLGALEEPEHAAASSIAGPSGGALIALRNVTVRSGGHTILDDVSLTLSPGAHVAIVGASGAGKSTLLGLLLGWHRPSMGTIVVDEEPLAGTRLDRLRRDTAWVDPGVHVWNRPLLDNLDFGHEQRPTTLPVHTRLATADLQELLEKLPQGLQTSLGEGGTLVSGGEGQRVRLGRALANPTPRLAVLDEPFRGLERDRRSDLLCRARAQWRDATLLCVTHDVADTLAFDVVVVLAGGRIVEQGPPAALAAQVDSKYRMMLDAESHGDLTRRWRTLQLEDGRVQPVDRATSPVPRSGEVGA